MNNKISHLEDCVFYGKDSILSLIKMLTSKTKVSLKYDGSPSIFCGKIDGNFFVSTKSIFNVNPKIYRSVDEIDVESDDLKKRLIITFNGLKNMGIHNIIQGDFLFIKDDIRKENIYGKEYYIFHPNTIVYAIPVSEGNKIINKKLGIAFHTSYSNDLKSHCFESTTFDSDSIWTENLDLKFDYIDISKELYRLSKYDICDIENRELLLIYINYCVRNNEIRSVSGFFNFIENRFQKEIDKRSSERGKNIQIEKMKNMLEYFHGIDIQLIFDIQDILIDIKMKIIEKLENIDHTFKTFVLTKDGYKKVGHEGYVVSNGNNIYKLVDRNVFSHNNFNKNVIKGYR